MNYIETAYSRWSKKRLPLPSEADVAALERRIEVDLPEDYRRYLLQFNGGTFFEPEFELGDDPHSDLLSAMRGIGATFPAAELASPVDLTLFDDNFPPRCLPIGSTSMGGLIVLLTLGEDRGVILFK